MSEDAPAGKRSRQRRGPKAAALDAASGAATVERESGNRWRPRDGERHLMNYSRHFGDLGDDDLFFRATRSIVTAARRWRKLANDRVKPVRQTMARWETLFLVAFSGDDLTQSELAHLISVEGPTMVRMLDVLARDGLIERRQSDTDRRVTSNRITPEGMRVIGELMGITNQLRREVLEDIDRDKLATTIEVLGQILRKIDTLR
ncbi:MarR family winged helix-turn-helix transcriptional regulator [Sphingomonas baiyangensis]|uniref:MarR family transcriptional regulator n=1 Tax=Sphingomonas baiyangensis TaxID=2572576 RepID=A0A4U1L779_9SPHN|nr:MarR family transcriptional regulator [Sphingomonas baiyangensis]TKD52807.1 MarR family transcriptional regulator [Sphingomonas baiyangensis]